MNVALFLDGDVYNQDAIFDTSPDNWLNHDNLLHVWLNMRDYLFARGYEVHTYDAYESLEQIDKAVFFGLYSPNNEYHARLNRMGVDCYYVAYEPPVIHHYNEQEMLRRIAPGFKRILTHQDDLIDGSLFLRISEGKVHPDLSRLVRRGFGERYFMMMMNSYRYANNDSYRELYSERFRASRFFERADETFHVYGRGINDPARIEKRWKQKIPEFFHSYVGEIENKMEVMGRYRFNLCIENCDGVYGYLSEKIIHCFVAGVVPVYWGPVNPLDYFDEGTFIDMRAFEGYEDLYCYLAGIGEERFNEYLEAIDAYLKSDRYQRFFGTEVFGRQIHELIRDDGSVPRRRERTPESPVRVDVSHAPKVSLLLPTRNRADLLAQSLESVAEQEYPNLEVVVVDDCSDDDTAQVVEKFRKKIPNTVYSRNPSPIGAALGFRRAAELASGEYVLNFSDDDLLADGALDAFVRVIQNEKADMVYTDLAVIDQDGRQNSIWSYRQFPDRSELLRCLLDTGGNVIPEVLLVRRELYDRYYGEYYGRRFITPFYLPGLGKLVLRHVPRPLYKYRIHRKSTFGDVKGLIVRNKGVTNFMNLIMFMYPPEEIFGIKGAGSPPERLTAGVVHFVQRLLVHGSRFFSGDFYTGASYGKQHYLWVIFYEYARRWLALARSYGVLGTELAKLELAVAKEYDPAALDPTAINLLPDVYRNLPWFSYRPINLVTEFIPFDMVTLGEHPALAEERYPILREGGLDLWVTNRVFQTVDDMMAHLENHPAQVVNLAGGAPAAEAMGALAACGKACAFVVDMTGDPQPVTHESIRHGTRVDPKTILGFENLLDGLRGASETGGSNL